VRKRTDPYAAVDTAAFLEPRCFSAPEVDNATEFDLALSSNIDDVSSGPDRRRSAYRADGARAPRAFGAGQLARALARFARLWRSLVSAIRTSPSAVRSLKSASSSSYAARSSYAALRKAEGSVSRWRSISQSMLMRCASALSDHTIEEADRPEVLSQGLDHPRRPSSGPASARRSSTCSMASGARAAQQLRPSFRVRGNHQQRDRQRAGPG
jgi:hypothetical protein